MVAVARRRKVEVAKIDELPVLGTAEVAAVLGWKRSRVAVSYSRGQLPTPLAVLACGPIWRREDIDAFIARDKVSESSSLAPAAEAPQVEAAPPATPTRKKRRHKWEEIPLRKGIMGFQLWRGKKFFLQVAPNEECGGWWAEVWEENGRTGDQGIVWGDTNPDWTVEDAKEAALAGLEQVRRQRRDPQPPDDEEPPKRICDCGRGYINDYPMWILRYNQETDSMPATEATQRRYREAVITYAIWFERRGPGCWTGAAFTPAALKPEDVAEFAVAMGLMHGGNLRAANRLVTGLAPFWRWAQREGYIPKGPSPISVAKLPEPKAKKKRRKVKATQRQRTYRR